MEKTENADEDDKPPGLPARRVRSSVRAERDWVRKAEQLLMPEPENEEGRSLRSAGNPDDLLPDRNNRLVAEP